MDKQTIVDGNKLIAQFMGYEYIPYEKDKTQSPGWWHKNSPNIIKGKMPSAEKLNFNYFLCRRHPELRYYNSWDWLIPVLIEIGKVIEKEKLYSDFYLFQDYTLTDLEIREIWENVVTFIKKYNNGQLE
ncbi:MAG: hypothetical protein R6U15_06585 [Candidatus Izemoplasmatales bacterium]